MIWIKDRVRFLRPKGKTQTGLAAALGIDPSRVTEIIKGDRQIKSSEVAPLAAYLEMTVTDVMAAMDGRLPPGATAAGFAGPPAAAGLAASPILPVLYPPGRPDVPVWASAQAGEDGAIVLTPDPIDYIHRSDRMRGVKNPFAFYVVGTSMSPAIEHGTQVVINPSLPPMAGRDHVFIQDLPDGTMKAMVKRLIRSTERSWRVRQFNELKDFDLLRTVWTKAYRITEKRED
jgi:transcriptional regulator with XRE-family HTH domain